jgi:polysaccharide export outer membrane protein
VALLLAQGGFVTMLISPVKRTLARLSWRRFCRVLVPALLLPVLFGPAAGYSQYAGPAPTRSDSPNPDNKGLTQRAPSDLLPGSAIFLHPGDLIAVSVYGVPDYKLTARIAGDGRVDLPLIGSIHLAGLTVEQAQQSVADELVSRQMILYPDVLISVQDSMVDIIGVMGEVNGPKAIPAYAPMSLLDAISSAGGLKPDASHSISILRKGVAEPLLVVLNSNPANAMSQDIPLYPGDRVLVSRVGVVYVVGAVMRQGAYPITPDTPMTLLQAVTLSGGAGFQASSADTRIIRTTGATRREIPVSLAKVIKGSAPDPILQSDDIVLVPTSALKAAIKGGGVGIAIGLLYSLPVLAQNF